MLSAPRWSRCVRHARFRSRTDGNGRIAGATLALDYHVHVELGTELEACSSPGTEMVARVDGAADMHASAYGPELLEVGVVALD